MEYKLPPLPDAALTHYDRDYRLQIIKETYFHSPEQMRQYAEQAVAPLLAEIDRLKRGEFICNRCGLRKNADTPDANF